jgi:hypothetical protein
MLAVWICTCSLLCVVAGPVFLPWNVRACISGLRRSVGVSARGLVINLFESNIPSPHGGLLCIANRFCHTHVTQSVWSKRDLAQAGRGMLSIYSYVSDIYALTPA